MSTLVPLAPRTATLAVGPYVPKLGPTAPPVNAAARYDESMAAAALSVGAPAPDPTAALLAPVESPALAPVVTPAFGSPVTDDAIWAPNSMPAPQPSELSEDDATTLPWIDTFLSSTPVRPMSAVVDRSASSLGVAADPPEGGGGDHAADRSAEAAAEVLESLARRIREGELSLPGFDAKLGDAAALAAVLSTILGVRH